MSADRNELHELIDELPEDQVGPLVDDLRRRLRSNAPRGQWPPEWFGAVDDPEVPRDLARNADKYLAAGGFGSYRS